GVAQAPALGRPPAPAVARAPRGAPGAHPDLAVVRPVRVRLALPVPAAALLQGPDRPALGLAAAAARHRGGEPGLPRDAARAAQTASVHLLPVLSAALRTAPARHSDRAPGYPVRR